MPAAAVFASACRRVAGKLLAQPGARKAQLGVERGRRKLHHGGHLLEGQPAEVVQLEDARLALVERFEPAQRVVQSFIAGTEESTTGAKEGTESVSARFERGDSFQYLSAAVTP